MKYQCCCGHQFHLKTIKCWHCNQLPNLQIFNQDKAQYYCEQCDREWNNDLSQQCWECNQIVLPMEIQKYGFYNCTSCKHKWSSAWTFVIEEYTFEPLYWQQCHKCTEEVWANYITPLKSRNKKKEKQKQHLQELCGRCKARNCPCTPIKSPNTTTNYY